MYLRVTLVSADAAVQLALAQRAPIYVEAVAVGAMCAGLVAWGLSGVAVRAGPAVVFGGLAGFCAVVTVFLVERYTGFRLAW